MTQLELRQCPECGNSQLAVFARWSWDMCYLQENGRVYLDEVGVKPCEIWDELRFVCQACNHEWTEVESVTDLPGFVDTQTAVPVVVPQFAVPATKSEGYNRDCTFYSPVRYRILEMFHRLYEMEDFIAGNAPPNTPCVLDELGQCGTALRGLADRLGLVMPSEE